VGTDNGKVYQITPVFKGTPPALTGTPWPITLKAGSKVSSPVLDSNLRKLMVGSYNGYLYQININSPTTPPAKLEVGLTSGTTPGVVAPPVLDITNGTTFVVSPYGAFAFDTGFAAVLVQVDTATLGVLQVGNIGQGSTVGTPAPALRLYEPAFSNEYYTDPSSGVITLCGTSATGTNPYQYTFGFTVPVSQPLMNSTGSSTELSASTTDRCTGWTEFYNPNIKSGVDFFFFGLTTDCTLLGSSGSSTGCVVALSSDPTIPTASATVSGGPSGVVVDNYSTAAEASSIYFTAENRQTAYKFTQSGLK